MIYLNLFTSKLINTLIEKNFNRLLNIKTMPDKNKKTQKSNKKKEVKKNTVMPLPMMILEM
jgi:hypothetical protein